MDWGNLPDQVIRHRWPVRLVIRIQCMAESFSFGIEYTGGLGCGIILFKALKHIHETKDCTGRFTSSIAQVRQCMVGTVQEIGSINQ